MLNHWRHDGVTQVVSIIGRVMNLIPLPAFSDNYFWLLHHEGRALVVDPGDAEPVNQWLKANQHTLDCILVTHHHADHVGGVAALKKEWGAKVYGPAHEQMPFAYEGLGQGDQMAWLGLSFSVLDVPGHTAGHIAFFAEPSDQAPCCFVATLCFRGGAAVCLKAPLRKCSAPWINLPSCP